MSSLTTTNPLANSGALDDFLPRPKPSSAQTDIDAARGEKTAVRQIAENQGFSINNFGGIVRAKRNSNGKASKSHTLRLYVDDLNRFQTWCNDHEYSQARGFEILLDRLHSSE